MCTFRVNHMMYGSWDIECDGQNFSLLWTIFCTFFKILKNWKKQLDISSFYTCVSKIIMITWCTVPEIRCAKDRWMNGQTNGQMDRQIDKWTDGRTDGQTDRRMDRRTDIWKKWNIEVGAPPKNKYWNSNEKFRYLFLIILKLKKMCKHAVKNYLS